MPNELKPELLRFAQNYLGNLRRAEFCGWDHAESAVWRLETKRGRAYLKAHRQPLKFRQELYVYENWLAALRDQTPELLAVRQNEPRALLLSALPGELAQNIALSGAELARVHRQAGAFLKTFHQAGGPDEDEVTLRAAVEMRLNAWLKRVAPVVPKADIEFTRTVMTEALPYLCGKTRVPCHRDYTGRNWLVYGDEFYVIDFEHSKMDFYLHDFGRLFREGWRFDEGLETAFFEGYGGTLDDDARRYMTSRALFSAATTIGWAREHGDRAFENVGWEQLEYYRNILQ